MTLHKYHAHLYEIYWWQHCDVITNGYIIAKIFKQCVSSEKCPAIIPALGREIISENNGLFPRY